MLKRNITGIACIAWMFSFSVAAFAQTSKPTEDALQPQTTWTGDEQGDPRVTPRRGDVARFATVNILTRDGERFSFEYWTIVNGVRHGLAMEGQIRNGQIVAQASKILQGGAWEANILTEVWSGGLKDETLIFQHTNATNNATITATMTLDKNGAPVGPGGTGPGGRRGGGRRGRGAPAAQ